MIRLLCEVDGQPILLLGLNAEHLRQLVDTGQTLWLALDEFSVQPKHLGILYGSDDLAIAADLEGIGVLPAGAGQRFAAALAESDSAMRMHIEAEGIVRPAPVPHPHRASPFQPDPPRANQTGANQTGPDGTAP